MLNQLDDLWHKNTFDGKFQYICACINGLALLLNLLAQSWGWSIWCLCFFAFACWMVSAQHQIWLRENEPEEEENDVQRPDNS